MILLLTQTQERDMARRPRVFSLFSRAACLSTVRLFPNIRARARARARARTH